MPFFIFLFSFLIKYETDSIIIEQKPTRQTVVPQQENQIKEGIFFFFLSGLAANQFPIGDIKVTKQCLHVKAIAVVGASSCGNNSLFLELGIMPMGGRNHDWICEAPEQT